MDSMTRPDADDAGPDPYFEASEVGPDKAAAAARDAGRGRRPYRRRMAVLAAMLTAVWMAVLADRNIAGLVLFVLAAFGAVVGLFAAAMGLGLLGFGLGAAGDRVVAWLRRGARWPDE
jgi:hypothetical protein